MLEGLDENTLDGIARIACGGDDYPVYRGAADLPKLLRQAGWTEVPAYDGTSRRAWLTSQLRSRRDIPDAIDAVVLRLIDKREYAHRNEPLAIAEVTDQLNVLLTAENFEVTHHLGRPVIRPHKPSTDHDDEPADVSLRVTMADIVRDPQLAEVLQHRLTEARICRRNGAYTSAMIMLGSLLEGILVDTVMTRLPQSTTAPDRWMLDALIKTARENDWIQSDVRAFSDVVRQYRNLVHPRAQLKRVDPPDEDTLSMCWPVINATLNDLAATAP